MLHRRCEESVGPHDLGANGLGGVVLDASAAAELQPGLQGQLGTGRVQLGLPPLGGVRLLRPGGAGQGQTLSGEHVVEGSRGEKLVHPLGQDVPAAGEGVHHEILRVANAAEPRPQVDPALDNPARPVEAGLEHAQQDQVEALDVLDGQTHDAI